MICFDASVAWKWFFEERHSPLASELLHVALSRNESIIAPPLLPSELTNIARQHVRRGRIELADAAAAINRFFALPIDLQSPRPLYERALALAVAVGLPATYDAQYVALSELAGASLWTADERLFNATAPRMPFVHLLQDYPS